MKTDTQYAIDSITKMYTAAVIIKLIEEGLLSFDDTVEKFFTKDYLSGLHVYKGKEHTFDITIWQLLSHTTWLHDLYTERDSSGKSLFDEICESDKELTFGEELQRTKGMKPHFIN